MPSVVELVRSWPWPRVFALAVIAFGTAACSSEATRFNSNPYASQRYSNDATGSVPQRAPAGSVQTSSLPAPTGTQYAAAAPYTPAPYTQAPATVAPAPATSYVSGGGRGMASYNPGQSPDAITTGGVRTPPAARPSQQKKTASAQSGTHVVAPGETLIRISRKYNMSLSELARLNKLPPHTKLKIGDRLSVPSSRIARAARPEPHRTAQPKALNAPAISKTVARAKPPHRSPTSPATPQQPELASVATPQADPPASHPVRSSNGGLSFRWPAKGRIITAFGPRTNGQTNDGINIALPEGTPVKAAEDGTVAYAGNELKGYGNLVLVRHADGYVTAYAHAKELLVKRGDPIRRGQMIARSGQTGNVDAPQLHFEIRKGPSPIDPMPHLSGG
jgi:murein DD-endopeptidase MepM/ murein hydrolase activator NlpD